MSRVVPITKQGDVTFSVGEEAAIRDLAAQLEALFGRSVFKVVVNPSFDDREVPHSINFVLDKHGHLEPSRG